MAFFMTFEARLARLCAWLFAFVVWPALCCRDSVICAIFEHFVDDIDINIAHLMFNRHNGHFISKKFVHIGCMVLTFIDLSGLWYLLRY